MAAVTLKLLVVIALVGIGTAKLTKKQKQDIENYHNHYRATTKPSAANMEYMIWDDELAKVAQNYANKCIWGHNAKRTKQQSKYHYVGENIYVTTSKLEKPERAVTSWHNEVKWYKFGKIGQQGTCKPGKMCGHYTQVVWAKSGAVGCGAKRCPKMKGIGFKNAYFVVCDYGPGGNMLGQTPYIKGARASKCPLHTFPIKYGLCYPLDRPE